MTLANIAVVAIDGMCIVVIMINVAEDNASPVREMTAPVAIISSARTTPLARKGSMTTTIGRAFRIIVLLFHSGRHSPGFSTVNVGPPIGLQLQLPTTARTTSATIAIIATVNKTTTRRASIQTNPPRPVPDHFPATFHAYVLFLILK